VQIHPLKTPLASDVNFRRLAEEFAGSGGDIKNAVIKAAVAAAAEPGADSAKAIHQQHFEQAMRDVLAAKSVMQQSLYDEGAIVAVDNSLTVQSIQRAQKAIYVAVGLASTALVAAIAALLVALG
jgi:ATP-dependent Zn protease